MKWEIEYTDEFGQWWETLSQDEQDSIAVTVGLLERLGPNLPRPHSDTVKGSRFPNMKELRTQHEGQPYRTLYAFDPRRTAILLIGGNKTGDNNWYNTFIPIADRLFTEHLDELPKKEKNNMAKSFNTLKDKISIERKAKIAERITEALAQMPLAELRQARKYTQEQIARSMNIKQASVSKMEGQADMYISTLRKYITAMGGELEIVAKFPDGNISIDKFKALEG